MTTSFSRPLALILGALLLGAAPAVAQSHGEHAGMHHSSGWKELDDFHLLMMQTWHPAKQQNDLAPVRAKAADMARAAEAWAASTPPEKCAGEEPKQAVARIAADSKALAELVEREGSDAEVKAALAALHDTFETVEHGCAGGGH